MNSPLLNLENCILCPRNCNANRENGRLGFCGQTSDMTLARAALHFWEEPCISGTKGSGAVFFCGCNLRCVFCQNADLSNSKVGRVISISQLSDVFLSLQEKGAHNINLITAGHFIPKLIPAIKDAKNNGLSIPIVYNTGTYEKEEAIKLLDGLIDIYLPDLKFYSAEISTKFAHCTDYFEQATKAIAQMYNQTGPTEFFEDGILKKGIIIRHLVLPGHVSDSREVVKYIYETYKDNVYVSIMNQYTPMPLVSDMHDLGHTLKADTYDRFIDYCIGLGIQNAYIQEGETCVDSFIPIWDYTGVPQ